MVPIPSSITATTQYGTLSLEKTDAVRHSVLKSADKSLFARLPVPLFDWEKQWPRLLDFIMSALLGSAFGAMKSLGEEIEDSMAVMLRFGICTLLLLPHSFKHKHWPSLCCGFCCGLPSAFGIISQVMALKHLSTTHVALFCNLHILFLPLLQYFRGVSIHKDVWKAAMCVTSGIFILQLDGSFSLTESSFYASYMGAFLAILQSLFYAMGYLIASEGLSKYPQHYFSFTVTYFGTIFGISFFWIFLDIQKNIFEITSSTVWIFLYKFKEIRFLCTLFWTSIVVTFIPAIAESFILTRMPVTEHIIISSTIPLWTILFSCTLLDEKLSISLLMGGSLILYGCIQAEWQKCTPSSSTIVSSSSSLPSTIVSSSSSLPSTVVSSSSSLPSIYKI